MKLKTVILTTDARSIGGHTSFSSSIRGQENFLIEYNEDIHMVVVTTGRGQYIIPLTSVSHMQADEELKSLIVRRRKRSKVMQRPSPVVEAVV
ncbi:hypothetical protein CMI37_33560 [Candidatus Pacearchaeota archaeon]|jgi:hypothetical protein|nr:hypothetical protein [Candidatus Pacearchaeota archaeon]